LTEKEEPGRPPPFKVKYMELRHNLGMKIVVLLAFVQGAMRTYFGLAGADVLGTSAKDLLMSCFDVPIANVMLMIAIPFFLLGISGIAATVGLAMNKRWGIYGTLAVSVATIAYDMWAAIEIQSSAVFGMIAPVIIIVYLVLRGSLTSSKAVGA
jgi:hypothetical protein